MKIKRRSVPLKFNVDVLMIILILLITPSAALLANTHVNFNEIKTVTPDDLGHEQWLMDEVSRQAQNHYNDKDLSVGSENIPYEFLEEVTHIRLPNTQISGSIPAEIGQLTNLTYLDLYRNQLSGSIPAEIGQLKSLTDLILSTNQLSGSIPAELGQLTSLNLLLLSDNLLSGSIPAELGELSSLNWLFLGANQLVGQIPSQILSSNIQYMDVSNNGLTINSNNPVIRSNFTFIASSTAHRLSSVETIEVSFAQPVIEPFNPESNTFFNLQKRESNGNLSPLLEGHVFSIYEGEDTTQTPIYEGLWDEELKITVNPLNSLYTVVMDHASYNDNNVTQIEVEVEVKTVTPGDLDHEQWLMDEVSRQAQNYYDDSDLSVESENIPYEFLKEITHINLRNSEISGVIPVSIKNLVNLRQIDLRDNQLSGSIPAEIGQLKSLNELRLQNNELSGSIPAEIGQLTNLTHLRLEDNELSGSIPAEIGQLTNLTFLYLHRNQLNGSIPAEIGQLTSLNQLWLQDNELSGSIPAEIGELTSLTQLYLSRNKLSGSIPVEIGELTSLNELRLQDNELSGSIPAEIGQLTSLTHLRLEDNELSGSIPAEIGQLTNLTFLYLHRNQLSGSIPVEIGQLTSLNDLWLQDNELSGSIPAEIGQLTNLTTLYLNRNQLIGQIPSEILSNNSLDLRVSNNGLTINSNNPLNHSGFTFIASSTAHRLSSVETIEVSFAQPVIEPFNPESNTFFNLQKRESNGNLSPLLEGHVFSIYEGEDTTQTPIYEGLWDEELKLTLNPSNSVYTVVMDLASNNDNNVTQIEVEVKTVTPGDLDHEQWLMDEVSRQAQNYYDDSDLSVESENIPYEFLEEITHINLHNSEISGVIPASIKNVINLRELDLQDNQLSGNIPAEIGQLSQLRTLNLADNELSGSIPAEIGQLTNLTFLYLHRNQLSGSIPVEIGQLTSLNELWLQDNELSGSIPAEIGELTSLTQLYFSRNKLSGSIPVEIGELTSLTQLWLQDNELSGSIPAEIGQLSQLRTLNLADNELSGSIPAEIGQLKNLTLLYLTRNQLSGSIPVEIGQLTSLNELWLQDNELSGSIPAEIGQLTNLTTLYLNRNQLIGQIPSEILSNNSLDLRVSNNGLTINSNNPLNHSGFTFIASSTAHRLSSVETIEVSFAQPVIEPFNPESNTFFNLQKRESNGNLSPLLEGHVFSIYEGEDTTQTPIYEGLWDEELKLILNPSNSVYTVVMDHASNNDNNVTQIAVELSGLE